MRRRIITIAFLAILLLYIGLHYQIFDNEIVHNIDTTNEQKTNTIKFGSEIHNAKSTKNATLMKSFDRYLDDIYIMTSFRVSTDQKKLLLEYINSCPIYKLDKSLQKVHRDDFIKRRRTLIKQWEYHYGINWNVYGNNVVIGDQIKRHTGQAYDAHHIIELSWNGPNEWWNLVPASYPTQHQNGIHRKNGVCSEIFGSLPEYESSNL